MPNERATRKRAFYEEAFKVRVVVDALKRPVSNRIKPTCACFPGIEPCQLRKWIRNLEPKARAVMNGAEYEPPPAKTPRAAPSSAKRPRVQRTEQTTTQGTLARPPSAVVVMAPAPDPWRMFAGDAGDTSSHVFVPPTFDSIPALDAASSLLSSHLSSQSLASDGSDQASTVALGVSPPSSPGCERANAPTGAHIVRRLSELQEGAALAMKLDQRQRWEASGFPLLSTEAAAPMLLRRESSDETVRTASVPPTLAEAVAVCGKGWGGGGGGGGGAPGLGPVMAMAVPMPSFAMPRAAGVPCGAGARRSPLPEMAFGRVLGAGCGLPGRVPSRVGLPPAAAFDVVPAFAAKSAEELLSDDGFLEEIGAESRGFVEDWLSELSVELTMNSAVAR